MTYKSAMCAMAVGLGTAIGGSPADAAVFATQIESDQVVSGGWDASAPGTPALGETPGTVRNNPAYALGPDDGFFFSMGLGGKVVLDFSTLFLEPATIYEVTFNCAGAVLCANHPESVNVWGLDSFDPDPDGAIDFVALGADLLGNVGNADAQGGASFTFLGVYRYLGLEDLGLFVGGDGWDLDAVSVRPIPLPAGLVLFLSGLVGIGFLGRYKAKRRESAVA